MIAELHGKISSSGSNLNDRLEDNLTGDFFGALRYIPFSKVMKILLTRTKVIKKLNDNSLDVILSETDIEYWANNISFWPMDSLGEIDLVIELEKIVIGIEVKLHSWLSSDDNIDLKLQQNKDEQSINQLSRESRILKNKVAYNNKSAVLILIAPEDKCNPISKNVYERNIIESSIEFGYLSWEEIIECLKQILFKNKLNDYEKLIIEDLITLLKRKGLERFDNFRLESDNIYSNLWFEFNDNIDKNFIISCNKDIDLGGYYEFR